MRATCIDLVLDTGELVRIKCPVKFEDKLYDSIRSSMQRKDQWSPSQFDRCTAEFLGMPMGSINMARVVGML